MSTYRKNAAREMVRSSIVVRLLAKMPRNTAGVIGNLLFRAFSSSPEGMVAGLVGTGVDVELEEATLFARTA